MYLINLACPAPADHHLRHVSLLCPCSHHSDNSLGGVHGCSVIRVHESRHKSESSSAQTILRPQTHIRTVLIVLLQASRQPGMTPETLQAEFAKFERSYSQSTAASGPVKWQRLNDFRNGAFAALQQDVQQRVNQAKQQQLAAEQQRAQQAELQAQQASLLHGKEHAHASLHIGVAVLPGSQRSMHTA